MSTPPTARPTVADVLRIVRNDGTMHAAAASAAVLARDWGNERDIGASDRVIGTAVRAVLPEWLSAALGEDDMRATAAEIGQAFYPRDFGHVTGRESLDALPMGALIVDRDGYVLEKVLTTYTASDGTTRHVEEYMTLHNPDDPRVNAGESPGATFDAAEIMGDYAEGESQFLPGRAYMIGPR